MINLDLIANQLRALPRLAQEAAQRTIDVSHNSDESGIRTAPTSRMPPGVNLDRIDLGWELLATLPRNALDRCDAATLDKYYEPAKARISKK